MQFQVNVPVYVLWWSVLVFENKVLTISTFFLKKVLIIGKSINKNEINHIRAKVIIASLFIEIIHTF